MEKYKPRKMKRRKTKVTVLDEKETTPRSRVAPNLDKIVKAVEEAGGDVGDDTVLGVLRQGRDNFEEVRRDADRRSREK